MTLLSTLVEICLRLAIEHTNTHTYVVEQHNNGTYKYISQDRIVQMTIFSSK